MPNLDHFDFIAPFYDHIFKIGEREVLTEYLDLPAGGSMLDAGGGTGRISQLFKDQIDRIVIADLSFGMLVQAAAKDGLFTTCTHTEKLPFPDQTFSRIIMIDALHHVCDHSETAHELWRVLKPGGIIILEEPDIRLFGVKVLAVAEKILGMRSHFISPQKIASLFNTAADIQIVSEGPISWVIINKPNA
jgi:demethylmenaquinone methyltransferase/2-methoxy-6-polyprenyl-1,4-benzoquinol methylase